MTSLIRYRVCDAEVRVQVEDPAVLRDVARLYAPYLVSDGAGPGVPDVCVRRTAKGHVVEWRHGGWERCDSAADLIAAVEYALTDSLLAACAGVTQLHAAAAVAGQRAVLALGERGAGKSSLALNWSVAGLPVLGDDVVLVDDRARVLPFRRFLKVQPAVLSTLGIRPDRTPFWFPESAEAWFDPEAAGGWGSAAPAGVVALLRYEPEAALMVRPLDSTSALAWLLRAVLPGGLAPAASFDRLAAIATGAPAYHATFGRAPEAARALAALAR